MDFMSIALIEAKKGVKQNHGGPFGAVIVRNGKVLVRAHNTVLKDNDATAHAEINVIRLASKKLKSFDLSDCVLYTTCMPCPMCLSAIFWANINQVFYSATSKDAEKIGFKDKKIYDVLSKKNSSNLVLKKIVCSECVEFMNEFGSNPKKQLY